MEEKSFLTENKMMTLATVGSDNGPRVVPVAFMYKDGKFYVSCGQKTLKVRNISHNNHVAFAVEDSTRFKAVVGIGRAKILSNGKNRHELLQALVIHLVGSEEHPYGKLMMAADRILLEITPDRTKSWEMPPTN
jgi:nitroimidazol reductase NimA-like FMN-containing flavoprotein (pyridoxamine 5'-phosphate oxidase superfamily)